MVTASPPPPSLPEPGRADDERTTVVAMLDYYRAVLARKAWGLDDDALRRTVALSDLSLGGLLHHMAYVEQWWFNEVFAGNDPLPPWDTAPWEDDADWDFHVAKDLDGAELRARFDAAVERSRAMTEAAPSLDALAAGVPSDRPPTNLRWILVHLIEEYARHCGHADYLRETIDGLRGD